MTPDKTAPTIVATLGDFHVKHMPGSHNPYVVYRASTPIGWWCTLDVARQDMEFSAKQYAARPRGPDA